MNDQGKTHEQLVAELAQFRQQVTELEAAEAVCRQTRDRLSASEKKYRELYESAQEARRRDLDDRQRAEQFLRASEERYRRIVETAREGIWILDASGKTTFVNQRMADMLGCMVGEMLYAPLYAFMDERDYALVADLLGRRRQGIAEQREFRFRRRDGTILWTILELTPITDEHGQYAGALAMVTDITERKRAEEALRESEARLRVIYQGTSIGLAFGDLTGRFVDINPALQHILGYSLDELRRTTMADLTHPDDLAADLALFQETLAGQRPHYQIEKRYYHKDGHIVWGLAGVSVVRDAEGNPQFAIGMLEDITERKRAEEALRESEELHRVTMEHIPDPVFITDDSGAFTFICANVSHILGYTVQELEAMGNVAGLIGDRLFDMGELKRLGEILHIERAILDKRGRERDFLITVRRVSIKGGTLLYVCHDITERKRVEEALRESEARYRALCENSMDAILLTAPDGSILSANPAACEMFGRTEQEICQVGRSGIVDLSDPRLPAVLAERARTGKFRGEVTHIRKDGTKFPSEVSTSVFKDQNGRDRTSMIIRDITERKRAEEALRRSEQELRLIADNVPALFSYVSADGCYRFVNKRYEEWFGIPQAEIVGKHVKQLVGEAAYELIRDHVEAALSGRQMRFEQAIPYARGGARWVLANYVPDTDEQGKVSGFFALVTDITERQQAEQRIRREAARAQALARVAGRLNAQLDLDTVLDAVCEETAHALGVPASSVILYHPNRQTFTWAAAFGLPEFLEQFKSLPRAAYDRVARADDPLIVLPDMQAMPGLVNADLYRRRDIRTTVLARLIRGSDLVGLLNVHTVHQARTFDQGELDLLKAIADQAAQAIANARLLQETQQRAIRLALLNRIARAFTATLNLDELMEIIHREITAAIESDAFFIALYDRAAGELDYRIRVDKGLRQPPERRPLTAGLTSSIITSKQPILIRDFEQEKEHLPPVKVWGTLEMPSSWLGMPILLGENAIGVISVQAYRPHAYDEAELELLSTIADTIAVAMENARLFDESRQQRRQLRALAARLATVEEAERRRLARELHDQVGQSLTALSINLNLVSSQLPDTSIKEKQRLDDSLKLVEETVEHIRDVMAELRPAVLDDYGLFAALRWYVERMSKFAAVEMVVNGAELSPRLPQAIETALFRITQEALTNVIRHAQASQVKITLEGATGMARLTIADDGSGFDPRQREAGERPKWGLLTMRERIEAVGGQLRVESAPGQGMQVIAEAPLTWPELEPAER